MAKRPDTLKPSDSPVLLTGGNPKIAKGYGDAPVQAYIAALPGWKHDVCRHLDGLITQAFPDIAKAVKWNSPFYGMIEGEWFLSFHAMTKYIKIAFFTGAALSPPPPVTSSQAKIRYLHIAQDEPIDEAQFLNWITQASQMPGERM